MGTVDRRVCYEVLAVYQDWVLVRSGGFFAFGKPPDFILPWAIPLGQCGGVTEVIEHLHCWKAIPYSSPELRDMATHFLHTLKN